MIQKINAELEEKEIDQVPGRGFVQAKRFQQMDRFAGEEQVSGSARLVVIPTRAEGTIQVERPAKPFGWGVSISQRIAVIVKKRLIPRVPVIAEDKEPNQNVDG